MIDWARVKELKEDIGDDDFAEVVDIFTEEIEASLEEMAQRFPQNLAEDLHFLKGSAANIGFDLMYKTCTECEKNTAKVDINTLSTLYFDSKSELLSGLQSM